ncbi:alpha/beta hydrolase family esterase [Leptospira sp. GIMC2001]|uniref:alpha/beta hydrolase family esterase n=1 Tax=Leptospira sp. GIMC2001 TaxID=1513297 RepID=UPI00234AF0A1|nr:alpha/beta fold hydrolase [Leptospira sp. GIMC2001]WCL50597.1 alpha/beta hydrolase-fold protein [Leptospira sp. GIMC2001]
MKANINNLLVFPFPFNLSKIQALQFFFSKRSVLTLFVIIFSLSAIDCRNSRRKLPLEYKDLLVETQIESPNGSQMIRSALFFKSAKPIPNTPLILIYHGGGGSAEGMIGLDSAELLEYVDKSGYAIAYMRGIGNSWNDLREDPIGEAHKQNIDDVTFTKDMISYLAKQYSLDIKQVYVAGISNGGMFALRLACEIPEQFVSIVSITSNLPINAEDKCTNTRRTNLTVINGTADPIVPFNGGVVSLFNKERGAILSTTDTMNHFRKIYQCSSSQSNIDLNKLFSNDPTSIQWKSWDCQSKQLNLIEIINGGHTWPGGSSYMPEFVIGKVSRELNASRLIGDLVKTKGKISKDILKQK